MRIQTFLCLYNRKKGEAALHIIVHIILLLSILSHDNTDTINTNNSKIKTKK